MSQGTDFTHLMEGVKGGCRTVVSEVGHPHAVTFSTRRGIVLIVTPEGELQAGPALAGSQATRELADMLIEYFGRAYRSELYKAEARAKAAESENKRLKHTVEFEKLRADTAERKLVEARR